MEIPRLSLETPRFSLETPRFILKTLGYRWRPQIFIGDSQNFRGPQNFMGHPQIYNGNLESSLEPPIFLLETPRFDWRPQSFTRGHQIFVGDPNFSLESPDFRRRLPNCHCRPLKLKIRAFLQHATGWSCLDVVINLTVLHSLSLSLSLCLSLSLQRISVLHCAGI